MTDSASSDSTVSPNSHSRTLRIATRASRLALWQAEHIADRLRQADPGRKVELVHISTTGDRDQAGSLRSFGGMGVFTREVQKALLDGRADIAVHSLKDLPTEQAAGLILGAVPERGPLFDALVLPLKSDLSADLTALPSQARVGTGSLRRQAQLLHVRPDVQLLEVRGNVETRLRKLDEGEYDALVLAAAGLTRLGLASRISRELSPPLMYPAGGQGALGFVCRVDDAETRTVLSRLNHQDTYFRVVAERSLLAELRAGCHAPVGTLTRIEGGTLHLEAVVLSPNGETRLHAESSRPATDAVVLGREVATDLHHHGAATIIHPK